MNATQAQGKSKLKLKLNHTLKQEWNNSYAR